MAASSTDRNVKNALTSASLAKALNVRGKLQMNEMIAQMALKATVQTGPLFSPLTIVLRYLAPTRQWKPWINVLFRMNITPVNHQAGRQFQKSIWPTSQTSLTSGCRRQNSLSTKSAVISEGRAG